MDTFTLRKSIEYFLSIGGDKTSMISDDLLYSKKAVLHHLLDTRATLIHQALDKGLPISESMVQTIPCLDLCEVDIAECPSAPKSGCTWRKSILPFPTPIRVLSVTDILGKRRFDYVQWDKMKYKVHSRTPSKAQYYTIRDTGECSYLYVHNDDFIEKLSVSAIFQEPQEAAAIGCGGEIKEVKCNPLEVKLYLDAHLRDTLFKSAWNTLIPVKQATNADIINNDIADEGLIVKSPK